MGFKTIFLGLLISVFIFSCGSKEEVKISIAEWSLHRKLKSGQLSNLDFPAYVREHYNIGAVEFVNQFFFDKANDTVYLSQLKDNCLKSNIQPLLIMVDGEGDLAHLNDSVRNVAVNAHFKWIKAARFLGCHAVRVNLKGEGTEEECKSSSIKSLKALSNFGAQNQIHIVVENHGGNSSNPNWLIDVIQDVNHKYCGTLPDFGNFYKYDRYEGVRLMMPFAQGVSAKSHGFNAQGEDTIVNFEQMSEIVKSNGYNGFIGVEYEGPNPNEDEGILKTIQLIKKHF